MADDVTFQPTVATPPAGTKVATDDVAGSHFQRVKLDVGGDGVSDPVVGSMPVFPSTSSVTGTLTNTNDVVSFDVTGAGCFVVTPDNNISGEVYLEWLQSDGNYRVFNGGFSFEDGGNVSVGPAAIENTGLILIPALGLSTVRARAGILVSPGDITLTALPYPMPLGTLDDANYGINGDGLFNLATGAFFTPDGGMFVPRVAGSVFNGSSWDRLRGDTLGVHVSRSATAETATLSNVSASASSVTLSSANTFRKGLSIHNDSSAILYVKFGITAFTTSYTVKMIADAYYELPFGYTGRIDGIWASATGAARITELT
jgi:hypothetical protein